MVGIFPRLAQIGFFFAQPYIGTQNRFIKIKWKLIVTVGAFIAYISADNSSKNEGYGLIGAFAVVYVGLAVSFDPHFSVDIIDADAKRS